jgi:hypothetical protein
MVGELIMTAQAMGEKKHLGMKRPGGHVAVKIGQVGILRDRLVERLPAELLAELVYQGRFANANIAGHRDELFHAEIYTHTPFEGETEGN